MSDKPIVKQLRLFQSESQTLSRLMAYEAFTPEQQAIWVLELPYRDNKRWVSCIKAGNYDVIPHNSPTFGRCFKILDVPDRDDILMHVGNFAASSNPKTGSSDTQGCQLPGFDIRDLDGDGHVDVISSGDAMAALLEAYPEGFKLHISERFMERGEVPMPKDLMLDDGGGINMYAYQHRINQALAQQKYFV
jgi:hypothetical protein